MTLGLWAVLAVPVAAVGLWLWGWWPIFRGKGGIAPWDDDKGDDSK